MRTPLAVTRIGHACQLLEIGGIRVLTDPWFTQTATYYQGEPVASTVESLGRVDAVVVSHEHYDHCDLDALVAAGFDLDTPLIGPGTVATIARDKGFRDVRGIEAWEATTVADLTVTATPGKHGVHEVTFVIQSGGRTVFFGGDSLYVPELDAIPERFGHVDLRTLRPADEPAAGGHGRRGGGRTDGRAEADGRRAAPLRLPQRLAGRPNDHQGRPGPAPVRRRGRPHRPGDRRPAGSTRHRGDSPVNLALCHHGRRSAGLGSAALVR
jgi:glyoxylase-like metal-dependent hydrolase (beta-lactamase superfamily II)